MRYRLDKKFKAHVKIDYWDTWDVNTVVAKMMIPLLTDYRNKVHGYPGDIEDIEAWRYLIDVMISAFSIIAEDDVWSRSPEEQRRVDEGLALFAHYFEALWN